MLNPVCQGMKFQQLRRKCSAFSYGQIRGVFRLMFKVKIKWIEYGWNQCQPPMVSIGSMSSRPVPTKTVKAINMKTNIQLTIIAVVCFYLLSACNTAQNTSTEKPGYLKEGALVCADYDTLEEYLDMLQHMGSLNRTPTLQHFQLLALHDHYSAQGCFLL